MAKKTKKTKVPAHDSETLKELDAIASVCRDDLCVEILWTTLNCMKKNPNSSILKAINCGIGEWVK